MAEETDMVWWVREVRNACEAYLENHELNGAPKEDTLVGVTIRASTYDEHSALINNAMFQQIMKVGTYVTHVANGVTFQVSVEKVP